MTQLLRWKLVDAESNKPYGIPWEETNPVSENPEVVLAPGYRVSAPEGEAEVVRLELQTIKLPDGKVELDIPKVVVKYLETNEEKVVCLCKLTLHNPDHQKLMKNEVERLWPPVAATETQKPAAEVHEEKVERYSSLDLPAKVATKLAKALDVSKVPPVSVARTLLRKAGSLKQAQRLVQATATTLMLQDDLNKDLYEKAEKVLLAELVEKAK